MKKVNPVVLIALVLLVVALLLPMGTKEGYMGFRNRFRRMQENLRRRRRQKDIERRRRDAARAREAQFRAMQRRGIGSRGPIGPIGPIGPPRGAPVN